MLYLLTMTALSHTLSCGSPGTMVALCCWTTADIRSIALWYSSLAKLECEKHRRYHRGFVQGLTIGARLLSWVRRFFLGHSKGGGM